MRNVLFILLASGSIALRAFGDKSVILSFAASTEAPHGRGNIYAPDILTFRGEFLMLFGGQGKDGHDRIHLATSTTGKDWVQQGVVFAPEGVNHVNDPSVVVAGGILHMFYTVAESGITDSIGLATSEDGRKWKDYGAVFLPSRAPAWDSLLVGRPSVIYNGKVFRMWFDGRKDLPLGAPDSNAPKSEKSRRFVGYATSTDGVKWIRRQEPVFPNAGGIHVSKFGKDLVMVIESRDGTKWANSKDGITWNSMGMLYPKDENSPYGHVTPFLLTIDESRRLYYGAAASPRWDQNSIYSADVKIPRHQGNIRAIEGARQKNPESLRSSAF
jgi:hypothetical protein